MVESKVGEGGSKSRPLRELALVVTLLFKQSFFIEFKVTLSWPCQGSNRSVSEAWSLCFQSAFQVIP
jgi:hypothetical protein